MKLLSHAALRKIENLATDANPPLMERAGRAAAALALARYGHVSVLVIAGPGNNGGDGFVMARELAQAGCAVTVLFGGDASRLPADAAAAYATCRATSADFCTEVPPVAFGLVVDALFGIGLTRPISDNYAQLVDRINAVK